MKIIDKINEKYTNKENFFSFEYFPPKSEAGTGELISIINRMSNLNPLWIDITWGAGGRKSSSTLFLASYIQNDLNLDVLMHITVRCQSKESIDKALDEAKTNGIVNILALRGDPPIGEEYNDYNNKNDYFQYAEDLIKYIKRKYNNYFCIIVAGYPNMHFDSKDKEEDLKYLKNKVEAGADAIISQLFFNENDFLSFEKECKEYGINVPIIPGIYTVNTYQSLKRMSELCKVDIPIRYIIELEKIKNDKEKVKCWGLYEGIRICRELIKKGVLGLHFYTMNIAEVTIEIIQKLEIKVVNKIERTFPWKRSNNPNRISESIRPVFWINNPKSYIGKTYYLSEYPNKVYDFKNIIRFFGEDHYESICKPFLYEEENKKGCMSMKIRSIIKSLDDIYDVFIKYFNSEIDYLPWFDNNDTQIKVLNDHKLKEFITLLIKNDLIVINLLPSINCLPSTDKIYGWGVRDGYIYQRHYIEFFINKTNLHKLLNLLNAERNIIYKASSINGEIYKNFKNDILISLTWGVFSNLEILQPIIYQSNLFLKWKDEAFGKWKNFFNISNEDSNKNMLKYINENYLLISIIDNDYVNPRIGEVLKEYINT